MEPETNNVMQKWVVGVIVALVVLLGGFGVWRWMSPSSTTEPITVTPTDDVVVNEVYFGCANDKTVYAKFYAAKVDLDLSDGRKITIPQVVSASGVRYANTDESFVFWNKGDTAFIQEKSSSGLVNTFDNCVGGKG